MDLKALILIILLSVLTTAQKFQCPFNEELNGCKCYPRSQSIICDKKANDFPDLSRKYHLKTITLESTNFSKINLHESTIDTLILINNHEVNILNPKISLQNLYITGENNFDLTQFFSKISVSNILDITAQNSKLFQELDTTIFQSLVSVKKLFLKNNNITKLYGIGLNKLNQLEEINLSNNNIETLNLDCLNFSSDKISIDISHNQLTLLQLDTSNLLKSTAILEVYLSFNYISTLNQSSFENLINKSNVIFLDNNPFKCKEMGNYLKWVFNKAENWQRVLRQVQCVDINKELFLSEKQLFPTVSTTINPTKVPNTTLKDSSKTPPPTTQPPVTPAPTTQPPVTPAPTTQPPVTPAPTTQPPVTPEPTTQPPVTPEPTTQPPVTPAPTTQPPVTPEPTTQPPVTPEPTTQPPVTPEPTTQPPVTPEPTTQPPVTPAPTTQPPVTPAPTTQPPVTPAPTTQPPVTPAPTTQPPVTPAPTTQPPVTPASKM